MIYDRDGQYNNMHNILPAEVALCTRCKSHVQDAARQPTCNYCITLEDADIPLYIDQAIGIVDKISLKSYKYSKGVAINILLNGNTETTEVVFEQNGLFETIRCLHEGDTIKIDAWKEDKLELLRVDQE